MFRGKEQIIVFLRHDFEHTVLLFIRAKTSIELLFLDIVNAEYAYTHCELPYCETWTEKFD